MAERYQKFVDADTEISLNDEHQPSLQLSSVDVEADTIVLNSRNNDIGPVNSTPEEDVTTRSTKYQKLTDETEPEQITVIPQTDDQANKMEPYTGLRYRKTTHAPTPLVFVVF